jgi:hypothetical protein
MSEYRESSRGAVARAVLKWIRMKMHSSNGKKAAVRDVTRRASRNVAMNLPRMFLFLELFVDKDIPERSTK